MASFGTLVSERVGCISEKSLRDIEACLSAQSAKLYHIGIRSPVKRSTLADANERLKIDYSLCVGHGLCVAAAPNLLEFQGGDQPTVTCEATASDLQKQAELAADSCPERAISIED